MLSPQAEQHVELFTVGDDFRFRAGELQLRLGEQRLFTGEGEIRDVAGLVLSSRNGRCGVAGAHDRAPQLEHLIRALQRVERALDAGGQLDCRLRDLEFRRLERRTRHAFPHRDLDRE